MSRGINNTRVLIVNCPKEMIEDIVIPEFHCRDISVVCIVPDTNHTCLDCISTTNFIIYLDKRIMNEDNGNIVIYLVNFRNKKAIENFHSIVDEAFPNNLIEFLDNQYLLDIWNLVSAYLYTIKENPNVYGYKDNEVIQMIKCWDMFCIANEFKQKSFSLTIPI